MFLLAAQPMTPPLFDNDKTRNFYVEVMDDAMADILRQKTEAERLRIAGRMWQSARAILRGAISTEHPEWSQLQVNREIARRISHGIVSHDS